MIRRLKTSFRASKETIDRLFECNRISGGVRNLCLALAEETHLRTGRWISKTELQKGMQGKFPIHSQSIQAICHKYLFARNAARNASKAGYHNKYPYKQKKHFNTKWANNGFKVFENGKIQLSMGDFEGKRQAPLYVWVKNLPKGQIKDIELIFDQQLMLSIAYKDGQQVKEHDLRIAMPLTWAKCIRLRQLPKMVKTSSLRGVKYARSIGCAIKN